MSTHDTQSVHWVMLKNGTEIVPVRYDQFVAKLFKPEDRNSMLHHAKGGICEEAGEISDVIKRNITYGIALDCPIKPKESPKTVREALVEELGDLMFYVQAVKNLYGINDFEIYQKNGEKLLKRYAELTWSQESARDRADETAVSTPENTIYNPKTKQWEPKSDYVTFGGKPE